MESSKYCIIITTTDEKDTADTIAKKLIEKRLAACVQLVPIESYYRWNETIVHATEYKLEIKTQVQYTDAIKRSIEALHNYDLPEFIVLHIDSLSEKYREWIDKETTN